MGYLRASASARCPLPPPPPPFPSFSSFAHPPSSPEQSSTALGYVAHVVFAVSRIMGLPLRYPIVPMGSRSFVFADLDGDGGTGVGGSGGSGSGGGGGGGGSLAGSNQHGG